MEQKRNLEALTGALVLIVSCFFLFFSYSSKWLSFQDTYTIKVRFDKADGLISGADIRMSGVKIGNISHIRLDPQTYFAIVSCQIHPDVLIPQDSTAEVTGDGLMGNKFLAIVPGGSVKNLEPGDMIIRSQAAMNLESLIARFVFSPGQGKQ